MMNLAKVLAAAGPFAYAPFERLIARCERDWAKCHCAVCGKALAHIGSPGRKCPECRTKPPVPAGPGIILVDLAAERATVE